MDIAKELDIITPVKFRELLEEKVTQDNVTYLDAIVDICERTGLEIESVPRMLNMKTKKILRNEAPNLNMLKKFINFIKKKPNYKNLDAKIWVQNIILNKYYKTLKY